jgi:hypothetical protein
MSRTLAIPLLLAFGLAAAQGPPPKAADWLAEHDAQTLKAARIASTDAGLLAYLGGLRPPPGIRRQVQELAAKLGDDNFTTREQATRQLTKLAAFARSELEQAARSNDREVARRAKAILAEYEAGADFRYDALVAVLREVARRRTPGAVPVLLATPQAWEGNERRRAAEKALAASFQLSDIEALTRALNDSNLSVRLAAAVTLLDHEGRHALPVLAKLLDSADWEVCRRAERVLRAVSGKDFGFVGSANREAAAKAAAAWQRWVQQHGPTACLALPTPADTRLGRVLICSADKESVVELDERARKVWQAKCPGAFSCQGLPEGHRLVGSWRGNVYEYDADGRLVRDLKVSEWQAEVRGVQRLPGYDIRLALFTGHGPRLGQYRPDNTVCWMRRLPDHPMDMKCLENGNALMAFLITKRVVEMDPCGKIVWEWRCVGRPASVQRLENGNTLVSEFDTNRVVEVNRDGKVVWTYDVLHPQDAQRLPNGHTVIAADSRKIFEIDQAGKVLWKYEEEGVVRLSAY